MSSRSVTPRVEYKLKTKPELRNSDKELLLEIWAQEGFHLSDTQRAAFMRTTPAESVTRARRALRVKYPGNEEVEAVRYVKYVQERDEYGQPIMITRSR